MPILKELLMVSQTKIKIGVFGPKPFFSSGHDYNRNRERVITAIEKKIKNLQKENFQVIGLTGIDIGVEEDFMEFCMKNKVPYYCYCTYELDPKMWTKLPGKYEKMQELIEKSDRKVLVGTGKYSPKKTLEKIKKIVSEADIIFIATHQFCLKKSMIISVCEKQKKTYSILYV